MNKNDLEFLRQWGLDYYISRVYLKDHSYEYYSGLTKPIIKKITEKDLNRFISLLESNPKFFRQKTKQVFSFSEYVPNIDFKKVQSKPLIQFLLTDQFLRIPAKADRLKLFMTCVKLNLYVPFKIFKNIELMLLSLFL